MEHPGGVSFPMSAPIIAGPASPMYFYTFTANTLLQISRLAARFTAARLSDN